MIEFTSKQKGRKMNTFIQRLLAEKGWSKLDKYGKMGVQALRDNTPVDTGLTAMSWKYEIKIDKGVCELIWYNTNVVDDWCNIAIMIRQGHATMNGGWVEGYDYITPALAPIFDKIKNMLWKEVVGS